ncbi:MAG: dTMP kinase [Candidatus Micrarchaeia archaeon]
MFIVFEGIDGSGKTTHAKLFHEYLSKKGIKNEITREPTDSIIGKLISQVMQKEKSLDNTTLQLLFTADRSYHINNVIKKYLDSKETIICDRYLFSTLAYGSASGISRKWLFQINKRFPIPDVTIVLDVPPKLAMKRIQNRIKEQIHNSKPSSKVKNRLSLYEQLEFLAKVRNEYISIKKEFKNYFLVNANADKQKVQDRIIKIFNKIMLD